MGSHTNCNVKENTNSVNENTPYKHTPHRKQKHQSHTGVGVQRGHGLLVAQLEHHGALVVADGDLVRVLLGI